MILKSVIVAVILCIELRGVSGISYSKVYMQSNVGGSHVYPGLEYVNYGAPAVSYVDQQIAQLTAPPLGSVLPSAQVSSYYSPCLSPCVAPCTTPCVPNQAADSARIVAYNSPRLPVVLPPSNDDPTSYQYSYVVYDDATGDHKAQREQSDGNIVQGQYSFLQPDGYVREVKYVADDVLGFNAVVNHFLPGPSPKSPVIVIDTKKENTPPCDVQSEALKQEHGHEAPHGREAPHDHVASHSAEEHHGHEAPHGPVNPIGHEASHSAEDKHGHETPHSTEKPHSNEAPHSAQKAHGHGTSHSVEKPLSHDAPDNKEKSHSHEAPQSTEKPHGHGTPHSAEKPHSNEAPHSGEEVTSAEKTKSASNKHGKSSELKSGEKSSKEAPESKELNNPKPHGHSNETSHEHASHSAPKKRESREDISEPVGNSYNDIIRCLQTAVSSGQPYSPLTYIIVPSKPC